MTERKELKEIKDMVEDILEHTISDIICCILSLSCCSIGEKNG